jgi:caspase domain-containing protein
MIRKGLPLALQNLGFVVQTPLLDARATRTGIRASIEAVAAAMDPATKQSATIVMFFSRHGFGENSDDNSRPRNFLATYETDGRDLKGSGLSVDELSQLLRAPVAGRILLILDACRNNPIGGKSADSSSYRRACDYQLGWGTIAGRTTVYNTGYSRNT